MTAEREVAPRDVLEHVREVVDHGGAGLAPFLAFSRARPRACRGVPDEFFGVGGRLRGGGDVLDASPLMGKSGAQVPAIGLEGARWREAGASFVQDLSDVLEHVARSDFALGCSA